MRNKQERQHYIMTMNILAFAKRWFRLIYMYLCHLTRPRGSRTVYFATGSGKYADNPRAISECLHEMAPDVNIVWLIKPQQKRDLPGYVTPAPYGSLFALKMQSKADVWVLSYFYRRSSGIYKAPDQFYIQTWHGDRGLKKIGYAAKEGFDKDIDGPIMSECDLFIAASDYGVMKARKGLRYEGEFMVEGMPRNDKLVNIQAYKDEAARIRERIGVAPDVKIVLYAPTFREGKKEMQCVIDIAQTIKNLETDGSKWICLVRAHAVTKGMQKTEENVPYSDVTDYPDMADLLLVTDILITDYSSCAGDFLLTGKPVVLAHFDRDDYQDKHRKLWVNVEEAGYLVAKNQQELNSLLSGINAYSHQEIDKKVLSYYGTKESGYSAEAVVGRIIAELNKR